MVYSRLLRLHSDLFIYIVSALVLLISETQVLKYRLNNEERGGAAAVTTTPGSIMSARTSSWWYNPSDSPVSCEARDSLLYRRGAGTFKILAELLIILQLLHSLHLLALYLYTQR